MTAIRQHLPRILILAAFFGTLSAQAQSGAFANQTPVNVALKKVLSSRNAKPGQDISATVEKPVTIGSVTLEKGSMLLGHVVEASKHTKDAPDASLTIVFDKATVKKSGGDPVAITASVYRISLSEDQVLASKHDLDAGMRGTASGMNTTQAVKPGFDAMDRTVQGSVSAAGAPVRVVSAVPGVMLSAVASDQKSAILSAKNADVDLGAGLEMVVGVAVK
jgi:hypothetical protein